MILTSLRAQASRQLQFTLAILKPDVSANPKVVQVIRDAILAQGFWIVRSQRLHLTKEKASEFYKEHEGKFFVGRLISFMSSGPCWVHVLAKENAIKEWRELMGPTKVYRAVHTAPGSLRGRFGLSDTRNVAHGSDSDQSAEREIQFFFPDFDGERWRAACQDCLLSSRAVLQEDWTHHCDRCSFPPPIPAPSLTSVEPD